MKNIVVVNLNSVRTLGFGLLLSASFPAVTAHSALVAAPDLPPEGGGRHVLTGNTTPEMLALLSADPLVTVKGNVVDPLRAVVAAMRDAVRPCGGGILSLGEGRSTFIYNLLSDREYNTEALPVRNFPSATTQPQKSPESYLSRYNIQYPPATRPGADMSCGLEAVAVDLSYPRHNADGLITDVRKAAPGKYYGLDRYDARVVPWVHKYPRNFRSQLFQELDLRDKNGFRLRFPLIFSSHALSSILFFELELELETVIDKTLDHLLPGGILVMAPVHCSGAGTVPYSIERYYTHLRKLVKSGIVSDFNVLDKNACIGTRVPMPASILVIIKSSATPEAAGTQPQPPAGDWSVDL